jgi:hypothetical protein
MEGIVLRVGLPTVVVVPVLVVVDVPVDVVWLKAGSSRTTAVANEAPRTQW